MKREPIQIREWRQGEARFSDFIASGPVPKCYEARLAELEQLFVSSCEATRSLSLIARVPSLTRCNVYERDGEQRAVENRTYEAHYYGPLADIDGEACADAVRALGEAAGRWAETLAEAAGIPFAEAVMQERASPKFQHHQRGWNLFIGWHARGVIMRAPIGTVVTE